MYGYTVSCVLEDKINRGSEWRRWELHLHTPFTKKEDRYIGKLLMRNGITSMLRSPTTLAMEATLYIQFVL